MEYSVNGLHKIKSSSSKLKVTSYNIKRKSKNDQKFLLTNLKKIMCQKSNKNINYDNAISALQ